MIFPLLFSSLIIAILSAFISPFFLFLSLPLYLVARYALQKKERILLLITLPIFFLIAFFCPRGSEGDFEEIGLVVRRRDSYFLLLTLKGKYMVWDSDSAIPVFSFVRVHGTSEKAFFSHYESGFNFKKYLEQNGVYHVIERGQSELLFDSHLSFQNYKNWMFSSLGKEERKLCSSLLFGDSFYHLEERKALESLGLSSILSLSGFHLSFFFHLFDKLIKKRKKKMRVFELIFISLFLLFSEFKFSIRRIFLLYLLRFFSDIFGLKLSYIDRLSIVGVLLLFSAPYTLFSPVFYYSFPLLFFFGAFDTDEKLFPRFARITLYFFPLRIHEQHKFNLISPFFQFILIPYSHLLFLLSLFLFICPPIGYILNPMVQFLLTISSFGYKNGFIFQTGTLSVTFFVLYYLILLLCEVYFFLRYKNIGYKAIGSLVLLSSTAFVPDFLPHREIIFIDVDQGDSTLIRNGKENILIDTGGSLRTDLATECLIPFFESMKISKIDAVIITHPDYDHNGALNSLISNFDIGHVYRASDFLMNTNHTLDICNLQVRNLNAVREGDSNAQSGVYQFKIREKEILIMGDAPKSVERKILEENKDLTCDILKIGHHGSDTSSSEKFLSAIQPELAVISCGYENRYHHPSVETLATLKKLNIPYRRTDLEGSIRIKL